MKPRHLYILLAGICGTLPSLQCVNPFGGGGTETGSPGMTACAFAIYNEIESPKNWSPETYLPARGLELDPGRAARLPAQTNGLSVNAASSIGNVVIMRFRIDTIITVDTLYVDTPVPAQVNRDSIRIILRYGSAAVADVRRFRSDKNSLLFAAPRRDTVLVAKTDSFFVKLTDSLNAPVSLCRDTIKGIKTEYSTGVSFPQRVTVDSTGKDLTVIADFIGRSSNTPLSVPEKTTKAFGRQNTYAHLVQPATTFGYIVDETYTSPENTSLSGPSLSRLQAGFTHTRGFSTGLTVLFDAGNDRRFPSIGDNRVVQLDREMRLFQRTLERVSYCNRTVLSTGDSIELTFDKHQDTGLVKDASIRYTSIPGKDPADHRDNRIARIHKALSFRDPMVQSIDLHILFDTPKNPRPFYDNARVIAKMYYGKGRTGRFEGILRAHDGKLFGIYIENDEESTVEYVRATNSLIWSNR
jgi:hypothetical protein